MAVGDSNATGNGSTFVITGTPTIGLTVREISGFGASIPVIDNNILVTTGISESIPGDLAEPKDLTLLCVMRSTDILELETALGVLATGTYTRAVQDPPLATGQETIGSGFIMDYEEGSIANNTLMELTVIWHWDGVTGPATLDETT